MLKAANISTEGAFEKSDLIELAVALPEAEAVPSAAAAAADSRVGISGWSSMSARELKQLLVSRTISTAGCLEKNDFLARCHENSAALTAPARTPESASNSPTTSHDSSGWHNKSARELRQLLSARGISTVDCFEKEDFLARCHENAAALANAPPESRAVPVGSSSPTAAKPGLSEAAMVERKAKEAAFTKRTGLTPQQEQP